MPIKQYIESRISIKSPPFYIKEYIELMYDFSNKCLLEVKSNEISFSESNAIVYLKRENVKELIKALQEIDENWIEEDDNTN